MHIQYYITIDSNNTFYMHCIQFYTTIDQDMRNIFSIYSKYTLKSQDIRIYIYLYMYIFILTYIIVCHLFQSHIISIFQFKFIVSVSVCSLLRKGIHTLYFYMYDLRNIYFNEMQVFHQNYVSMSS